MQVHMTPSKAGARGDCRWSQRLAFPRQRATARRWNKRLVQELLACDGFTRARIRLLAAINSSVLALAGNTLNNKECGATNTSCASRVLYLLCSAIASFTRPSFSCSLSQVNKIKYGKNWRNKERKKEPLKGESLPSCFLFLCSSRIFLIYLHALQYISYS